MIKGLMGSDGVFVENGNNSLPYHSPQQGDSFSGVLRLNGTDKIGRASCRERV